MVDLAGQLLGPELLQGGGDADPGLPILAIEWGDGGSLVLQTPEIQRCPEMGYPKWMVYMGFSLFLEGFGGFLEIWDYKHQIHFITNIRIIWTFPEFFPEMGVPKMDG